MQRQRVLLSITGMALAILVQSQAQAISLRFKSKIFSSGPDIYACNAGVAANKLPAPVCYFHNKHTAGNECTPTDCSTADKICNTDCVCDDPTTGAMYVNSLHLSTEQYTDTNVARGAVTNPPDLIAYGTAFTREFPETGNVFNQRITNLFAKFSSENYTGEYFFDICYRATQLPAYNGQIDISGGVSAVPFIADPNSLATIGYPGDNDRTGLTMLAGQYLQNSGLTVQIFSICSGDEASTVFQQDGNGVPTGGPSFVSMPAVPVEQSVTPFNVGTFVGPHFCKIRYVLRETSWNNASIGLPVPNRSNTVEGAELCTYTSVVDPKVAVQQSTTASH